MGIAERADLLGDGRVSGAAQRIFSGKELFKEVPRVQRYAARPSLAQIFGEKKAKSGRQRDGIIYRAYVKFGYRMVEIAEYLGVHYATISRAVRRGEMVGTRNRKM